MSAFLYPPPDIRQPAVIIDNGGGIVDAFERAADTYKRQSRRVEIRGSCRSACTLALSVPSACVGRGAVVKFHEAFNSGDHRLRPDITEQMLAQMPMRVRYAVQGKITVDYSPAPTLDYSQLVALGIPDCDAPAPQMATTFRLPDITVAALHRANEIDAASSNEDDDDAD